jgi:hypothetical protein
MFNIRRWSWSHLAWSCASLMQPYSNTMRKTQPDPRQHQQNYASLRFDALIAVVARVPPYQSAGLLSSRRFQYCTFSTSCSQGARRDTCSFGEVVRADRRRVTTCLRFLFLVSVSLLARLIRYPAAPGLYKNRLQHVTALAQVSSNNSGMWRKAPVAQSCSRQTPARDNLFSPGSGGAVRDARRTTGRKSTVRSMLMTMTTYWNQSGRDAAARKCVGSMCGRAYATRGPHQVRVRAIGYSRRAEKRTEPHGPVV